MRTTYSLLLLTAAFFVGTQQPDGQDPKPKPKTTRQKPAPQDPKKVVGKKKPHELEGVYRLRERVVAGLPDKRDNRGYLVITGKHLFLSLAAPGSDPDHPLIHSSVRGWTELKDAFRTTMLLDYHSDENGNISFQKLDTVEERRIEPYRGGLRVIQGDQAWLTFERIE